MKFKDAYHEAPNWQKRVVLISLYHNAMLSKHKDWKLTNSAEYFGVSIGLVSESLNLSNHWSEVYDANSRNEALKRLK